MSTCYKAETNPAATEREEKTKSSICGILFSDRFSASSTAINFGSGSLH